VATSPDELLLYARHGWPECCDQVMHYTAVDDPAADNPHPG
jgi:hypothetical protein